MEKRWITFDLDGTLMQNPFGQWVFPEIETTVLERIAGESNVTRALVAEHNKRMKEGRTYEAYDWDDILQQFLKNNGILLDLEIVDLVKKHSTSSKVYLLEEGLLEPLTKLKEKGYSLAAATNGYFKYQAPVLEALNLIEVFDEIITPEEVGVAKPDIKMLETLSGQGKIVAHVGDRIDHDVHLANQLGIPSVLILRNFPDELKRIAPADRNQNEIVIKMCKEKWQKETGVTTTSSSLPDDLTPTFVIHSIQELESCLGEQE